MKKKKETIFGWYGKVVRRSSKTAFQNLIIVTTTTTQQRPVREQKNKSVEQSVDSEKQVLSASTSQRQNPRLEACC